MAVMLNTMLAGGESRVFKDRTVSPTYVVDAARATRRLLEANVPAGLYPLPSTLLMTVIPAQVAGVATTCVASPKPSPEILAIAKWLGVLAWDVGNKHRGCVRAASGRVGTALQEHARYRYILAKLA